jgi:tRNA pseudouridine55 synthase
MNEILLIDKPAGWTSFDVVAKIRGKFRADNPGQKIKVGHSGTLDPFATGLLIVLVGDATKKQDSFMKLDKEYEATLCLGATSTTGDPEGEVTPIVIPTEVEGSLDSQRLTRDDIQKVLEKFIGEIEQTPPAFSAIKIDGQRAYKLARAGKEVAIPSRKIQIHKLQITKYKFPELNIRVSCSSGTYIRTLAEDIGKELGCGAYLLALRRTKIGEYSIKNAQQIEDII